MKYIYLSEFILHASKVYVVVMRVQSVYFAFIHLTCLSYLSQ